MRPTLTIPAQTLDAALCLLLVSFFFVRPQSATVSGITTPAAPLRIGPLPGEFWTVAGNELAPQIAEAHGAFRLAVARDLADPATRAPIVWAEADQVEVGGIMYDVTWLPPPSALDLTRIVGLNQ